MEGRSGGMVGVDLGVHWGPIRVGIVRRHDWKSGVIECSLKMKMVKHKN